MPGEPVYWIGLSIHDSGHSGLVEFSQAWSDTSLTHELSVSQLDFDGFVSRTVDQLIAVARDGRRCLVCRMLVLARQRTVQHSTTSGFADRRAV